MKVAFINTFYELGSTGRIVKEMQEVCLSNSIQSFVYYGPSLRKYPNPNVLGLQNKFERKWSILKCRIWPRHAFYNKKETQRLITNLENFKPDVIHLHNLHNHYINVAMLFDYIKKNNIAVVWTLHDCWALTGWCAYYDYTGCDKWQTVCHHCPQKKSYPFTWFFDLSKSNYQRKKTTFNGVKNLTIVTPSKWLAEQVSQSYLNKYPIEVIYNGIDTSSFLPVDTKIKEHLKIGKKGIYLAVASKWSQRKGIYMLKKMSSMLQHDECLVIVGLTKRQAKWLKHPNCICIRRTNSIHQLAEYYSAADVFINPTMEETFGMVNAEALACGTPVVTFNTGGSPEAIDGTCGIVVPKGDVVAMLEAARDLSKRDKIVFSKNGVNRVHTLFEKSVQYRKYIDLYRKIII